MNKSEKEKMLSGEPYFALDEELVKMREKSQSIWLKFNMTGDQNLLEDLFEQKFDNLHINPPFHCDYGQTMKFGKNVFINYNCTFLTCAEIAIGDNCWIGPDVKLYTAVHPLDAELRKSGIGSAKKIKIGSDCWLGGGVVILPGVTVGSGSTIGAGSVVTKDIPSDCVAAGNPCKIIRKTERKKYE